MPYYERKCPNCGTIHVNGDTYCQTCRTPLGPEPKSKEKEINGIKVSDLHLFVDKNSTRYVEIFTKNENNKVFFKMNWAAFFFNFYWMMYRKMYKYAAIFLAVNTIFSVLLTVLVVSAFKPALLDANKILDPYGQPTSQEYELYTKYFAEEQQELPEGLKDSIAYQKTVRIITGRMLFWIFLPSLIFRVIFALLADCIYRAYILRNIGSKHGGTSGWAAFGGILAYPIISNIIENPILESVITSLLG